MSLHERLTTGTGSADAIGASDQFAELRDRVHQTVIESLGAGLLSDDVDEAGLAERVRGVVNAALQLEEVPLSHADREVLSKEIADEVVGYGPLERFLADDAITEIMVNNHEEIYIERGGRIFMTDARFADDAHLRRILDKIVAQVGRRIDEASAMVDARLPDGSRVNAIIPPLSLRGPAMTIRKFHQRRLTMEDMVTLGTLTPEMGEFIGLCVRARLNILVTGGTGSGKTTLLNVLSSSPARGRADRDDRGRGRAEARPAPLAAAGVAAAQRRGPGSGVDSRPGAQRPAHAPRPDRRRRGARRRGAGHAAGDEHRPRRLAVHRALQLTARRRVAPGDDGADVRLRPAGARDPRADRLGAAT